jgi:phage baseplate assembly protein gpV
MQRTERTGDAEVAMQTALRGLQSRIWTSMPGIVESYDAEKMTCVVRPSIQGLFRQKDETWQPVTMPLCPDVPVQFGSGGGYAVTFPIEKGDEGILVFSARCIDAWWQNGGVQPQAERRMHDLSDAFFIPGIFSQPKKLDNVSTSKLEMRTRDGTQYVSIDKTAGIVEVKATASIVLDAPSVVIKEGALTAGAGHNLTAGGVWHADDFVTTGGVSAATHKHGGVQPGGGQTGVPV